ncbi:NUDIX domain-containing protein [Candidatus Saccharibacteria bacterium]|nr:NUDIX domain-containing protein [Candidatus Saccharibacteria bacterium]
MKNNRPQVGVGLLVVKDGQILLGRRKNAHGDGEYGGPGGHLELGETIEECAKRELAEEAGSNIKIKNLRFLCFINLRKYMPKHYAHIHMMAEWRSGEPQNLEPEVRESWAWYSIDDLPQPLFGTTNQAVDAYKTGKNFFEA